LDIIRVNIALYMHGGFIFEILSPNSGTHSTDLETLMQLLLLAFRRKPTEAARSALGL